ncbi:3-hydroxyacyl-CoA dehydrogenase NAD-binding domain-containing protein [Luteococcus sp. Sow4_B9]|uniref:3-hydroxyacyl-CoA dehydrogenase/enoyl-CoA hydratase family protein n=1 Tax=Luteococcus sp. Sow4_B9 TaxID=3438792 RepID=UPI003F94DED9
MSQLVPQVDQAVTTAAVIGAGSMGSGIAAHMANAGIKVLLFDVPSEGDDHEARSARARKGIELQVKRRGFMQADFAQRVEALNTDDDLARLAEAEWIVEAVFEDPAVKADIYAKIAAHRRADSIVSSNTSTIPLSELASTMDEMAEYFLITHFFNPPRVMRLVEVVQGERTRDDVMQRIRTVIEQQLGKVALTCRDTPGFIANRVGNFWLESGAQLALDQGIAPELADAVFSKPFGVPRTGIFGLLDYIGLQVLGPILNSLHATLPQTDRCHRYAFAANPVLTGLVERGLTGRSGPSGFYRGRDEVVTDDFEYRPKQVGDDAALAAKGARAVMETDSPAGRYAWKVFSELVLYCCEVAEEIAETVDDIDQAMVLGYGWAKGPFALADQVGLEWIVERLTAEGTQVPELLAKAVEVGGFFPDAEHVLGSDGSLRELPAREGVLTVAELVRQGTVLHESTDAAVHRIDDRGTCLLTLRTPMNSLTDGVFEAVEQILERWQEWGLSSLLIASDNVKAFSAGADLSTLTRLAQQGDREAARPFLRRGADTMLGLRFAPFPVVGAFRGLALGGGAELALACAARVVHAEAALGFPELNVGLYPCWGGATHAVRLMTEAGLDEPVRSAFDLIAAAAHVQGAFELEGRGLLAPADQICLSLDHVVSSALELARSLAGGYTAPEPATITRQAASWSPTTGSRRCAIRGARRGPSTWRAPASRSRSDPQPVR